MSRDRLISFGVVLAVCWPIAPAPAEASVKPPLDCKGVESAFGNDTLTPVQLMCLTVQWAPDGGANNPQESTAVSIVGRRFSVLFEPDTYNTSEHSHWTYDQASGVVEVDVTGNRFSPAKEPTGTSANAAWWKVGRDASGLQIRTDYLDSVKPYRAVYLAELGMSDDPARLGASPFYTRLKVTPQQAAIIRRDILFQADGVIAAPKGANVLHCGQLAQFWRQEQSIGPTQDCVYAVKFTYFAFRLAGSGRVLVEWKRP